MASINGIEIKSVKRFKDHDGLTIAQGNVYYNGKKLGFWSQDSWGGEDDFDFDEHILDDAVAKYTASDMVEEKYKSYSSLSTLLCDLLVLIDSEKRYKYGVKRGYKSFVEATDGYHVSGYYDIEKKDVIPDTKIYKTFVKECQQKFFKNKEISIRIYNSLDDFKVAV